MEIAVELFNQQIQEIITRREDSWSKRFSNAIRQVTRSLEAVEKAALNVGQATKRAWGSLTRPMEQHGLRLSEQVIELCRSLTTEKPGNSYEQLKDFEERSTQAARSIAKIYNKYAGSIIRSAKPETSVLEDSIVSLNRSVLGLSQTLEESRLKEIKAAAAGADRLVQDVDRLHLVIEEHAMKRRAMQELADRESGLRGELSTMCKVEGLGELNRIEAQIRQKETETLALVEPLSKPLRKVDRPDIKLPSALNRATLDKLVENPLGALLELPLTDMHEALHSLDQMIGRGDLMLDERRKRRAMRTIEELQSGVLERLREDYSVLQANRQEAQRQLRASGLYDQWSQLRNQIDEIESEKIRCRDHIAALESQEAQQRSLVIAQKTALEKTLGRILEEKVSIALSF